MTKKELWEAFLQQHPQFKEEESIVKLKSRGLKRLTDQAWDEGYEQGKQVGKMLAELTGKDSMFGKMFGGK